VLGLERPRDELYARIDARVDAMMASGLREEFELLRRGGARRADPGMQAIGYREFFEGALAGLGQGAIADRIKLDTRRYAKRQMTFFRGLPGIEWIGSDPKAAALSIAQAYYSDV
jgi:tRNA dimethylallyltransferase